MTILHPWDIRTGSNDSWWWVIGMDWIWVELSDRDVGMIKSAAQSRDDSNRRSKKNYAKGSSLVGHEHGYAAELSMAHISKLGINQETVLVNRNRADLGNDIEVKSTQYAGSWRLYVNESTMKPQRRYVLCMTYLYPKYVAAIGWVFGSEIDRGPDALPWRKSEKAFWCPWTVLHDMNQIVSIERTPALLGIRVGGLLEMR